LEVAKKNKTVERILIVGSGTLRTLSVRAAASLLSVALANARFKELSFNFVTFQDFGPIVFAFRHNANLQRLELHACPTTPNLVAGLHCLLSENTISTLRIYGAHLDLSAGFRINTSIRELVLGRRGEGMRTELSPEMVRDLPLLIARNQKLQNLELRRLDLNSDTVRSIAQAAEEHRSLTKLAIVHNRIDFYAAEAIGKMLLNATNVRELFLRSCSLGATEITQLFSGLANEKCDVELLDLSWNSLGDEGIIILCQGLDASPKLKKLLLCWNDVGDRGARAIAGLLENNITLQELVLQHNRIGPLGAGAIAESLETNVSLTKLSVGGNRIGDDGASRFAHMLIINATLQALSIGSYFGKAGLDALVASLPDMRGLKSIEFEYGFFRSTEFTSETGDAFVAALERNTTLEHASFGEWVDTATAEQFMPRVDRLTALNRGGSQLITEPEESVLPLNYWPTVLSRSTENADVIFFFLCEKHDVLLVNSGTKELIAHLFSSLPFHD
jgi:hypothetical protein